MEFIAHRVNTTEQLAVVPHSHGVELDLRDYNDQLILQHEPFENGQDFSSYLKQYSHGTMILNIKSERIEHRVLEAIAQAETVKEYFFLDCSFPMIQTLVKQGEHRIAVRFSEFEPIESALALAGQVDWVWVDCFTHLPINDETYSKLSKHFKICIVSPELQGYPIEHIDQFAQQLRPYKIDAVCTKRADLWQSALASEAIA